MCILKQAKEINCGFENIIIIFCLFLKNDLKVQTHLQTTLKWVLCTPSNTKSESLRALPPGPPLGA